MEGLSSRRQHNPGALRCRVNNNVNVTRLIHSESFLISENKVFQDRAINAFELFNQGLAIATHVTINKRFNIAEYLLLMGSKIPADDVITVPCYPGTQIGRNNEVQGHFQPFR